MKAQAIIKAALRDIGVASPGFTISPSDEADALEDLNHIIDSLSTVSTSQFERTRESFPLVADQAEYTIGSGGDFNTTRPEEVHLVWLEDLNTDPITYEMELIVSRRYDNIQLKGTGTIPNRAHYDPQHPLGKFFIYPTPSSSESGWNFFIDSMKAIAQFTDLTTDNPLPAEYFQFLRYQLGLVLASPFGKVLPPWVQVLADQTERDLKNRNFRPTQIENDLVGFSRRGRGNIYGDDDEQL